MGSHEDDAAYKGSLRSIWTHTVDISRLQGQHQQHQAQHQQLSRPCSSPGSPSKAFISSAQAQALLPGMRAPGGWFFLGRLDREVLCNALACAGASMADPLMSMVDTYFSGKLGTTALAALGSNGALFSVMYFLCFTALAVLCTQAMASANSRGDAEGVGRGFLQALAATAVVSGLLVALLLAAPEQLLGFFQTNAEVMPYAKTYCMIRALSLPAALGMNVCQAAFRSLLDLSTPFAVVMTANAANYLLDGLLMFRMGWGMAGCGWASVISQYIGAGLFAAIIVRRRHQFGIPEALACAADRLYEAQQAATAAAAVATAKRAGYYWPSSDTAGDRSCFEAAAAEQQQQQKRQQWWWLRLRSWVQQPQQQQRRRRQRLRVKSQPPPPGAGHVASPSCADRAASGSFRINVFGSPSSHRSPAAATAAVAAVAGTAKEVAGSLRIHIPGMGSDSDRCGDAVSAHAVAVSSSARVHAGLLLHRSPSPNPQQQHQQHHQQQQSLQECGGWDGNAAVCMRGDADLAPASGGKLLVRRVSSASGEAGSSRRGSTDAAIAATAGQPAAATVEHQPLLGVAPPAGRSQPYSTGSAGSTSFAAGQAAAEGSPVAGVDASSSGSSSGVGGGGLPRVDSVGSDSKLPRLHPASSTLQRLVLLLRSLEWQVFVRRFLGMSLRGLLILSTYSSASMVAARAGTASLAAHQVVQQQQQVQMSFAWSFLHVGQSMTANVFHASAANGGGPKAARRLARRIVSWATGSCVVLALLTYNNRHVLSGLFTRDAAVQRLVGGATLPATVMLGLAWNNALEGCLLAADDQAYVVKVYPYAVSAALLQLGRSVLMGLGLPGVWWGLVAYYMLLLLGFAGRFWVSRAKI